jgi:hypothetical protein
MMGRALLAALALAALMPLATTACGKYGPPERTLQAAPNPPPPAGQTTAPQPQPSPATPPAQTIPPPAPSPAPSGGTTPGGGSPQTP